MTLKNTVPPNVPNYGHLQAAELRTCAFAYAHSAQRTDDSHLRVHPIRRIFFGATHQFTMLANIFGIGKFRRSRAEVISE